MSDELKAEIAGDPEYSRCMLDGYHKCEGRLTNEHALYYANKKVQRKFAIVRICAAGHGVDQFQDAGTAVAKEMRVWVALNRATDEEIQSISKVVNYFREKGRLNAKYGQYVPPKIPVNAFVMSRPTFIKARTKAEKVDEMEREARRYARTNGCDVEVARALLTALN